MKHGGTMGNFDIANFLVLVGAIAALGGAGFSIRAGNLVLTNGHGGLARSVVAFCLGVALIAVGVLLKTAWGDQRADDPPGPTAPPISVSSSSLPTGAPPTPTTTAVSIPPVAFTVVVEQPVEGARVPITGTIAAGSTAGALADGETLWLFVVSEGVHYLTAEITLVGDGTFSVPSGQVGAKEEGGLPFIIEVVRANSTATKLIDNLAPNAEGDRLFKRLPPGTSVLASRKVIRA